MYDIRRASLLCAPPKRDPCLARFWKSPRDAKAIRLRPPLGLPGLMIAHTRSTGSPSMASEADWLRKRAEQGVRLIEIRESRHAGGPRRGRCRSIRAPRAPPAPRGCARGPGRSAIRAPGPQICSASGLSSMRTRTAIDAGVMRSDIRMILSPQGGVHLMNRCGGSTFKPPHPSWVIETGHPVSGLRCAAPRRGSG